MPTSVTGGGRGNHPNAMIEGIGDVDVTGAIEGHPKRIIETAMVRRSSVAEEFRGALSCHRRDDLRFWIPHPDEMIVRVGDVKLSANTKGDSRGPGEPR